MTASPVMIQLEMTNQTGLFEQIKENRTLMKRVLPPKIGKDRTVTICGAGPSLREAVRLMRQTWTHEVWGCNSAVPYLMDHGVRLTHAVTVDQSPEMFTDEWEWQRVFPELKYYIASAVHPDLTRHLQSHGIEPWFFHSYLGVKDPEGWVDPGPEKWPNPPGGMRQYEMFLYQTDWPTTVMVGHGLNTVPRAICAALWLGFKKIYVYGADCACAPDAAPMPPLGTGDYTEWLKTLVMYCDGRSPIQYGPNCVISEAEDIDGQRWHTRPDMIISAQHLLQIEQANPGKVFLLGNILPNAMKAMPPDRWEHMPSLNGSGGVEGLGLKTIVQPPIHTPETDPELLTDRKE